MKPIIGGIVGLLFSLLLMPQSCNSPKKVTTPIDFVPTETLYLAINLPHKLMIINSSNGDIMVSIDDKGLVTYGPHFKLDETSKLFWEAMAYERIKPCGTESQPNLKKGETK